MALGEIPNPAIRGVLREVHYEKGGVGRRRPLAPHYGLCSQYWLEVLVHQS